MTRQFKIISLEPAESERSLIVTNLANARMPITLDAGREIIASVHDGCEAVIISKRMVRDIDDPLFNVEILRDDPKSLNELARENATLRQRVADLEAEAAAGPRLGPTAAEIAMIDAIEARPPVGGFEFSQANHGVLVTGGGDPAPGGPNIIAKYPPPLHPNTGDPAPWPPASTEPQQGPVVIGDDGQIGIGTVDQAAETQAQADVEKAEAKADDEWKNAAPADFAPEPEPAPVFPSRKAKPAAEPTEF